MTQCNHLGLGGLLELVEAEFEDKEDEVVVVVLEAIEAAEATDPEVKPEKKIMKDQCFCSKAPHFIDEAKKPEKCIFERKFIGSTKMTDATKSNVMR